MKKLILKNLAAQLGRDIKNKKKVYYMMTKFKSAQSRIQFCVARLQEWPYGIFSEIAEGVWSVTPFNYETVYVNHAIEKIYDRYSEEFYEKPQLWREVIHPIERERVEHSLSFLDETDCVETLYHILKPSGEIRLIHSKYWAVRDEKGKLERIDCIQRDISDRMPAEIDWQKLMTKTTVISYELVYHTDGSEEFTYISPNCREIWGINPQGEKSINIIRALIHPSDREVFDFSLATSEKPLKTWKQEWRQITPSGKIKWFSGIAYSLRQANGDVIWYGLIAEITEEKQQKKKNEKWQPYPENIKKRLLKATEEKRQPKISQTEIEQFFNLSSTLLCITDVNGYFKWLNPAWQTLLGYDIEEMLSYSFLELVHPEDVDSTLAEIEKLGSDNKTLYFENRFRCQDGSYKWLAWAIASVSESGLLYKMAMDITERKYLEAQRDKLIASLEESRELYRSVLNALAEGVVIQDISGSIRYCNESAERLLGLSAHELFGMTSFAPRWQTIQEDGSPFPIEEFPIRRVWQTAKPSTNRVMGVCKPDGTLTWVLVNAQPLFFPGKTIPYAAVASFTDITKLKQVEKNLQTSQRRYQILADLSPVGIFHTDTKGNCIYINKRCSELLGMCFEEAKGQGWSKTLHPEDRDRVIKEWYEAVANKQPFKCEYRFLRPDNSIVWVLGQALAEVSDNGEVIGYVGTITDISERKQTEATLQQALEKQQQTTNLLKSIINTTTDWIFAKDTNFRYILVNQAMADSLRMKPEEMLGKNDLELGFPQELVFGNPAKNIRGFRTDDIAVPAGKTVENNYEPAVDASGVLRIFDTKKIPLRDANGRIFGILGCAHDITYLKKTEDDLRRAGEQFRELAQREILLNHLANQIRKSLNLDTILETATQEIREFLQVDRCQIAWYYSSPPLWKIVKEAKSTDLPSQLIVYPCLNDSFLIEKLLRMEPIRIERVDNLDELERSIYQELGYASLLLIPIVSRFDCFGVLICSHNTYRCWLDSEVELLQAVAVQIAIAIQQAELYNQSCESAKIAIEKSKELEAALKELRQTQANLVQAEKMSSLGQLVAGIAHEINNPVNFIYGNIIHGQEYISELLNLIKLYQECYSEKNKKIEDKIQEIDLEFLVKDLNKILSSMQVGAKRIQEIVKSLRSFSRLDEAEMKEVDLHENIDSTLMILQHRIKAQPERPQIEVIKRYGNLPLVECYAGQLNQVFMNIIANAIDALEEKYKAWRGGQTVEKNAACPELFIEINTAVVDSQVQIQIADSGKGIPPDVMDKIFDPFYTTKPIGSGTGLGLSISYKIIVEKHRGKLRCNSEVGKGTKFIIEIPLQQVSKRNFSIT